MSRLARLLTFVALCLFFAACSDGGSASQVTTTNPETEEPDAVVDSDVDSDIEVSSGVAAGAPGDDGQSSGAEAPVAPAAPEITSPAARQDAQSVGGVEPEAEESEPADEVEDAGLNVGADGAQSTADEAAPVAPGPTGPVVDIPVFPSSAGDIGDNGADAAEGAQPPASPTTRGEPAAELASDSCGSSCEIGGTELAPETSSFLEPETSAPEAEASPSVAELAPDLDDICPEGSGQDCVADLEDGVIVDAAVDEAEAEDEATCEARPWMVGCDGPVPEEGDYEPQEIVEREVDESAGVQVPQEIQDLLLAPIND